MAGYSTKCSLFGPPPGLCMAGRQVRAICFRRLIQRPAATQWLGCAGRSELPSVMSGAMHPGDLGGNTAGEVVRQASDDDRDGGNVPGRLATYGQHGVVLAAPGRQVRPGSLWAELPCPLKAATASAVAPGPGLARRRRARSAVTMRWSYVQRRAWLQLT